MTCEEKKTRSLKENESISICPNKRNNSDAIWHTVAKNALQIFVFHALQC